MNVVMLLYQRLTQLDLTGPFEVFARVKEFSPHPVWKTREAVIDSGGLQLTPANPLPELNP
jgi:cyclohexyl-isocyanide hydratase